MYINIQTLISYLSNQPKIPKYLNHISFICGKIFQKYLHYFISQKHRFLNSPLYLLTFDIQLILIIISKTKRQSMYNLYLGQYGSRCKVCHQRHRPDHSCSSACPYCHQYHPKTLMTDPICPHLREEVKILHEKDEFQCRGCQGEGVLEKQIITIFYEREQNYLKRVKRYVFEVEQREGQDSQFQQKPERKVIRTLSVKEEYLCEQCQGSGKIRKVTLCCVDGCSKCSYQRCRINPIWSSYFCEPISVICVKRESCQACAKMIELSSEFCRLECGHKYHCQCYVRDVHLAGGQCVQCGQYHQNPISFKNQSEQSRVEVRISEQVPHQNNYIWRQRQEFRDYFFDADIRAQQENVSRQNRLQSNIQQERQQQQLRSINQAIASLRSQMFQQQTDQLGNILVRQRSPELQQLQSHEISSEGMGSQRSLSFQEGGGVFQ